MIIHVSFQFSEFTSGQDALPTVLNSGVCAHLAKRASFNSTTDSFSWGHDHFTLACKARPSFDGCGTLLSVSLSLSLSSHDVPSFGSSGCSVPFRTLDDTLAMLSECVLSSDFSVRYCCLWFDALSQFLSLTRGTPTNGASFAVGTSTKLYSVEQNSGFATVWIKLGSCRILAICSVWSNLLWTAVMTGLVLCLCNSYGTLLRGPVNCKLRKTAGDGGTLTTVDRLNMTISQQIYKVKHNT